MKKEAVSTDLASIHIHTIFDLLDCLVLDSAGISSISRKARVNTDDRPVLEFSTRAVRSRNLCAYQNIGRILLRRPDVMKLLTNLPGADKTRESVAARLDRHFQSSFLFLQGILASYEGNHDKSMELLINGLRLIPESRLTEHFFEEMDQVNMDLARCSGSASAGDPVHLILARREIAKNRYRPAPKNLAAYINADGEKAAGWYEMGREGEAAGVFRQGLERNPSASALKENYERFMNRQH